MQLLSHIIRNYDYKINTIGKLGNHKQLNECSIII